MAPSWAEIFYRACTILAGVLVLLTVADFLNKVSYGYPMIPVVPLVLAVAIWLIGRYCRHLSFEQMN